MFGKRKIAALVAEFIGTGVLTMLILSIQRSPLGISFFIGAAAGLTVTTMMLAVASVSGGHFNPALTIGLWTARKVETLTALMYVAVQLLGAWAAYGLYNYFHNTPFQAVGGKYSTTVLVAELVGAAIFTFGVAAAIYQGYNRAVTAATVGLSLMLGVIVASNASLGLINPAVALGDQAWVWGTYVLGPILGGVIGVNLYGLLFSETPSTNVVSAVVSKKSTPKKKTTKK